MVAAGVSFARSAKKPQGVEILGRVTSNSSMRQFLTDIPSYFSVERLLQLLVDRFNAL